MEINFLSLQDGDDFSTFNGIIFRQPTVSDVKFLGESLYFWWMNSWCNTPYDLIHDLWKQGIDFEKITKEELFIDNVKNNHKIFMNIFSFFTNVIWYGIKYDIEYEMDTLYVKIKDKDEEFPICPKTIYEISTYIKTIHYRKDSVYRKFATESDKKKILEYEIEEREFDKETNKKNIGYIASIKKALVVYGHKSWEYVSNLYIYQLFSEMDGISRLEDARNTYSGIYSRMIDYKKIDKKILDWIN